MHDPLFSAAGAGRSRAGAVPRRVAPVDAAVLQADHAEYRTWTPEQLPGVRAIFDGRNLLDPTQWPEVSLVSL